MAIKPILFNTEMVRAILDGRKTQTRRLIKAKGWYVNDIPKWAEEDSPPYWFAVSNERSATVISINPPYERGDILWVRETWTLKLNHEQGKPLQYAYRADLDSPEYVGGGIKVKYYPSIHMPKEAARLFLRVTDVRPERLRAITEDDAMAEGATPEPPFIACPYIRGFADVWERTLRPGQEKDFGWAEDPWVWVISFERCEKPEGRADKP